MNKRKLFRQIMACLVIALVILYGRKTENEHFVSYYDKVKDMVMHQMTGEEVRSAGRWISQSLIGMPEKVVTAVAQANDASKYGQPIDEKSDSKVQQVHACAGGMVLTSGWDRGIGLYIKIKHEDAVSTYGNLQDIGVVQAERVQRGEIIGSYNRDNEEEFYYELRENL